MKAISPKEWGSSGWSLLHRLSFCFKNAKDAAKFYNTLTYILPCPKCKKNMLEHFVHLPIPKKSNEIPEWLWRLHNRVNYSIDKNDVDNITFEEVRNKYIYTCHKIDSCESIFLLAVAETHPGNNKMNSEYKQSLKYFITTFINYSFDKNNRPVLTDSIFESRVELRKFIQNITHTRKKFNECTVNL